MNASRALPGAALVAALAAVVVLWACIGDLPPLPDGQDASGADARDDLPESAALPDVASPDATPPDATSPDATQDATPQDGVGVDGLAEADAGSVTPGELCAAEHDLAVRCGSDGAGCYGANEAQCSAVAQTLSDAARRAYVACVPDVQCVTGYDFIGQTCVKRALAVAAPTPEQAALRNDICAACGGSDLRERLLCDQLHVGQRGSRLWAPRVQRRDRERGRSGMRSCGARRIGRLLHGHVLHLR